MPPQNNKNAVIAESLSYFQTIPNSPFISNSSLCLSRLVTSGQGGLLTEHGVLLAGSGPRWSEGGTCRPQWMGAFLSPRGGEACRDSDLDTLNNLLIMFIYLEGTESCKYLYDFNEI